MKKAPIPIYVLRGHGSEVNSIKFLRDRDVQPTVLISGDQNGELRVWDLKSRRTKVQIEKHHSNAILHIDFLSDTLLCSQGRDGVIKIVDVNSLVSDKEKAKCEELRTCKGQQFSFCKCSVLKDRDLIVAPAEEQSKIIVFDVKQSKDPVATLSVQSGTNTGMLMCLHLFCDTSTNATRVLAGYENGHVYMWDLKSAKELCSFQKLYTEPVLCVNVWNNLMISGATGKDICVTKLDSQELVTKHSLNHAGCNSIAIRDDGRIFATGGWDHRVRLFDLKKHKPLGILKHHLGSVHSVEFAPQQNDKTLLASSSKDQRIAMWELEFKKKKKSRD